MILFEALLILFIGWVAGVVSIFILGFMNARDMNKELKSKGIDINKIHEMAHQVMEGKTPPGMTVIKMEMPLVYKIQLIAKAHNWNEVMHTPSNKTLSYMKNGERINIYYSKMTVGTAIDHPKQGKTQLFRKNVTMGELEEIFKNPRVHTDKGYKRV